MIFGSGFIARHLENSNLFKDFNIIAKGVSDSTITDQLDYYRQEIEILKCISIIKSKYFDRKTVYISSIISNSDSIYFRKKLEIEATLRNELKDLIIVRLSNVVGNGQNPRNIFPFFLNKILLNEPININIRATRNLIDINDVIYLLHQLLQKGDSGEIYITYLENITAYGLAEIMKNQLESDSLLCTYEGMDDFVGLDKNGNQIIRNYFNKYYSKKELYIANLIDKYKPKDK